ncbi:hypothetical protein PS015_23920, partial [Shigella sonnei]|nr:hypothetical protein [Shigella sonnei]
TLNLYQLFYISPPFLFLLADDVRLLRQEEQERRRNIEKLIQIERNAKARIRSICISFSIFLRLSCSSWQMM